MSPLRARLIAAGVLRPQTNELMPVQLPPGTVVFRVVDSNRVPFELFNLESQLLAKRSETNSAMLAYIGGFS